MKVTDQAKKYIQEVDIEMDVDFCLANDIILTNDEKDSESVNLLQIDTIKKAVSVLNIDPAI